MNDKVYEFYAEIKKVDGIDGAYIEFPYDALKPNSARGAFLLMQPLTANHIKAVL